MRTLRGVIDVSHLASSSSTVESISETLWSKAFRNNKGGVDAVHGISNEVTEADQGETCPDTNIPC